MRPSFLLKAWGFWLTPIVVLLGWMFSACKRKCISSYLFAFKVYFCLLLFSPCGIYWYSFWVDFTAVFSPTLFSFSSLIVSQTHIYWIKSELDTDFDLHKTQMLHFASWLFFCSYTVKSMLIYVISITVSKLFQKLYLCELNNGVCLGAKLCACKTAAS